MVHKLVNMYTKL